MTDRPPRTNILFLHGSADLYGSDITLLQLVERLNKKYFNSSIVLPLYGPLVSQLEKEGGRVYVIDMPKIARQSYNLKGLISFAIKSVRSIFMLRKIIKENHISLIHSNTMAVFSGAILCRICGVRHLWHVHEIITHPALIRNLLPWLVYGTSDMVIANSYRTARWLKEVCPKIDSKTKVVLNGVDNSRFHPGIEPKSFQKDLSINSHEILVGLIGRISRLKGQKVFVEAAEVVLAQMENLRFVIVGDPPLGQEHFLRDLKNVVKGLPKASKKVQIIPFREDIEKVYAACDILIIPSTEPESFSLVAAEAMAMAKPVIASAHGNLIDIVLDGITGILVKPGDVQGLARAILRLANNKELRQRMGRNGYERQRKLFSVDRYVTEFSEIYDAMAVCG